MNKAGAPAQFPEAPRWLADLRDRPWAPSDVLDLPKEVLVAARGLLGRGAIFPFCRCRIFRAICETILASAYCASAYILPDAAGSIEALLLMLEEAAPLARMGETIGDDADALAALARQGADLRLPGWPLLAALLRQPGTEPAKLLRS